MKKKIKNLTLKQAFNEMQKDLKILKGVLNED